MCLPGHQSSVAGSGTFWIYGFQGGFGRRDGGLDGPILPSHATEDHLGAPKHTGKRKTATEWLLSKGWGQVIAWIEQDKQEVINVIRDPPAGQPRRSPESSDDDNGATGSGEPTGPLIPGLAFANWPFANLEVDLSSKTQRKGRMDADMAEAIAQGARQGAMIFDISIGDKKNPWVYRINFETWTQENLGSKKVRKIRFPTQ